MSPRRYRWLVTPMLLAFAGVFLPALVSFVLISLHPATEPGAVGADWTLDNYRQVLTDEVYLTGLGRSVLLGVLTVAGTLLLGVPLSYYIARYPSRFAVAVFTLLYVSSLTSVVIRGLGWITLLGSEGPLNRTLRAVGLVDEPLHLQGNLIGLTLSMVHYLLPYMVLTLLPVMQAVPRSLEEASAGLGAGFARTARSVVLPLARPGIVAGSLLVFALSISSFVIPRMVGGTTIRLTAIQIDEQMLTTFNYAIGSALASILLVLVVGVVALSNLTARRAGT